MNYAEVRNIIESTLKSGSKTPGLFDLPKILGVKSRLEGCTSISEVLAVLDDNRSFVSKSFGVSDAVLDEAVTKIKALDTTA